MPPRRGTRTRTRTTPATAPATATATTQMTDATIRALIAQGAADALAEQEIQRNTNLNDDGSQGSRSGITRPVRPTRECTYSDFLKCQPLNFKGIEGVVGLTQWRMFPEESDVVEKYVGGLPDMIQRNVMSTKPKTMEEAIKMANNLMDQKLCTLAKR
ncbi:hypothetical protein Tco_0268141 [Tanacetum coccineum]